MADYKTTSYRLSLDTLTKLDRLVTSANEMQKEIAEAAGFKIGKKLSRADLLDTFINQEYFKSFPEEVE